jgi:hypothetical protein
MKKEKNTLPSTRREKRTAVTERLKNCPELGDRAIARQLGVAHSFVGHIRSELGLKVQSDRRDDWYTKHPYIIANPHILDGASERTMRAIKSDGVLDYCLERNISPRYAQSELRRLKRAEEEQAARALDERDIVLRADDVLDGLSWIADNSVNAIITDAPYDIKSVRGGIYKAIALVAERVLMDGSVMAVMVGSAHLDQIIPQIAEVKGLRYIWLVHYVVNGGRSALMERRGAISFAKPVLVYVKGGSTAKPKQMFTDLIQTAPLDRKAIKTHPHEQDTRGFEELVRRFTAPDDIVLDPCCGSGTTGVACVNLKRRFIGSDIDVKHIETARKRLMAALETQPSTQ